jgi:hypothetical protein
VASVIVQHRAGFEAANQRFIAERISKTVFEQQDRVASNLRLNDIGTYWLGQRVFETSRCEPFGLAEPKR